MVEVFREVRRVLRSDGTCWVNMGDSYAAGGERARGFDESRHQYTTNSPPPPQGRAPTPSGLKPKDLCGIPWRVAFALQADGWWLRQDIIWHKPNPMPESVTDRCTKSHEYIFLLAKGQSRTRTILFSDVTPERVHFGRNFGQQCSDVRTTALSISLATALFDAAQGQENFTLPPFYSEEWEKRLRNPDSNTVPALPPIHWMSAQATRFLNGQATSKEFLHEIQRTLADLGKADHLLISRALSERPNSPSVFVDGDTTIAIYDTGKVSKIDFLHGSIIDTVPTDCKYFYDAEAIKEPAVAGFNGSTFTEGKTALNGERKGLGMGLRHDEGTRNKRSVWTVPSYAFPEAHFATYPPDLIKPCILAGTSARGCCPKCGAPWERVVEKTRGTTGHDWNMNKRGKNGEGEDLKKYQKVDPAHTDGTYKVETLGWKPQCQHGEDPSEVRSPIPCTVVDPFAGSFTTCAVALELGRSAIGIELNPAYVAMGRKRCAVTLGLALS